MLKRMKPSGWSPFSWRLELDQVHMKLEEIMGLRLGRKQVPWREGVHGFLGVTHCRGAEMHNFTIFAWQGQVLPPVGQGENQDLEASC